jgi:hypothetical protein
LIDLLIGKIEHEEFKKAIRDDRGSLAGTSGVLKALQGAMDKWNPNTPTNP